jgi:hypothetical protein
VPIHIWHVFFDAAYSLSFDRSEELVQQRLTAPTEQVYQAPGGATTRKVIYKHYYHYGYPLGESTEESRLLPAVLEDKNGHILPYVTSLGGRLALREEALAELRSAESDTGPSVADRRSRHSVQQAARNLQEKAVLDTRLAGGRWHPGWRWTTRR